MEFEFLAPLREKWQPVSKQALIACLVFYVLILRHAARASDGPLIDNVNLVLHESTLSGSSSRLPIPDCRLPTRFLSCPGLEGHQVMNSRGYGEAECEINSHPDRNESSGGNVGLGIHGDKYRRHLKEG